MNCAQSDPAPAVSVSNLCVQSQVEQWKRQNSERLISCRWGLKITTESCHAYQTRSARYVLHFNGDRNPFQRVNADYLRCMLPEPCPHLLPDSETESVPEDRPGGDDNGHAVRLMTQAKARTLDRLVNPDRMLNEPDRYRSLVKG
jgi:hypothetical protein